MKAGHIAKPALIGQERWHEARQNRDERYSVAAVTRGNSILRV
jgi:hypothetical protein